MPRPIELWDRFWYAEGSSLALGVFRFLFAYALFREVGTTRWKSTFAIEGGGFHLPYLGFIRPVSAETYELIHTAQYVLIALLAVGLLSRAAAGGLVALQGYVFFADQLNFRNHPYFFILILSVLVFAPADDALSLRTLLRIRRHRLPLHGWLGSVRPLTFQRLIQVEVCIAYFYAGLHKVHPAYLRGEILRSKLADEVMSGASGDLLTRLFGPEVEGWVMAPAVMIALAWLTVLLELSLPFALWFRRTRPWAMLLGIPFHVGIAFTMHIGTFSIAMISSYLLFLDPGTLPSLVRRLARRGKV